MAFSNPSTKAVGSVLTAANWNEQVANTDFLARPPSVSLTRTTEQSLAAAAWRSLSWNAEGWDTDTMWSSTAPTRIDINTAGKYLCTANAARSTAGDGNILTIGFTVGGSTTAVPNNGVAAGNEGSPSAGGATITRILSLTSTQFIRVQGISNGSTAATIVHSSVHVPSVSVLWVSS